MNIPTDLTPLSRVARALQIAPQELCRASVRQEFPAIYEPIPGRRRVSQSAVESWITSRTVREIERKARRHGRSISAKLEQEDLYAP